MLQKQFPYCVETLTAELKTASLKRFNLVQLSKRRNVHKAPTAFIINWICCLLMHTWFRVMDVTTWLSTNQDYACCQCAQFQFNRKSNWNERKEKFTERNSTQIIKCSFILLHKMKLIDYRKYNETFGRWHFKHCSWNSPYVTNKTKFIMIDVGLANCPLSFFFMKYTLNLQFNW